MLMGQVTNDYAKLRALKVLLSLESEKGAAKLQVFGDSMNVIMLLKWGKSHLDFLLFRLLEEVHGYFYALQISILTMFSKREIMLLVLFQKMGFKWIEENDIVMNTGRGRALVIITHLLIIEPIH